VRAGRKLRLGEENIDVFHDTLKADVALLAALNIMDYSLLVSYCDYVGVVTLLYCLQDSSLPAGLTVVEYLCSLLMCGWYIHVYSGRQVGIHDKKGGATPSTAQRRASGVVLSQQQKVRPAALVLVLVVYP
jgi:hypothetical protein